VHQSFATMIRTAVQLLVLLGRGELVPHHGIELSTSLVVRASTAPPPARTG